MAKKKVKISVSNDRLVEGFLTLLIGILFLFLRGNTIINIAMTVFGVALLVLAILDLLDHQIFQGVVKAVVGVVVLIFGWAFVEVALIVLAIVLLVWGIYELYLLIKHHVSGNALAVILRYISPILSIVIGVLLLVNRAGTVDAISVVIGVVLIIDAILLFYDALRTKKKKK